MKVACPTCSQNYDIPDDFLGKPLECEKCTTKFMVYLKTVFIDNEGNEKSEDVELTSTMRMSTRNIWYS